MKKRKDADMNGAMRRILQLATVFGLAVLLLGMGSSGASAEIVNYKDTTTKANFKKGCDSVGGAYTEEHGGKVGICTTGGNQDRCNFKTHACSNGLIAQPGAGVAKADGNAGVLILDDSSGSAPAPAPGATATGGLLIVDDLGG